jgi:hypothetical protein
MFHSNHFLVLIVHSKSNKTPEKNREIQANSWITCEKRKQPPTPVRVIIEKHEDY